MVSLPILRLHLLEGGRSYEQAHVVEFDTTDSN